MAAVVLLVAQDSGYAATLGVTLVLALVLAWGWPRLTGSWTPAATTAVLGVASVAIVLSALREDLLWVPAAVAFGIVLAFVGQLVRRTGREGLVLTLLSSFGGLVVIASGTTAVVAADTHRGQAVAVVAMAAVAAAVVADLLSGVRVAAPLLGFVALVVGMLAAVVASRFAEVGTLEALGIGAAVGTVSWSFRRVLVLEPAVLTVRGQVSAVSVRYSWSVPSCTSSPCSPDHPPTRTAPRPQPSSGHVLSPSARRKATAWRLPKVERHGLRGCVSRRGPARPRP